MYQFDLPIVGYAKFLDKVAELNRGNRKAGIPKIEVQESGRATKLVRDDWGNQLEITFVQGQVVGLAAWFDGWKLMGVISENVINTIPGESIPEEYRGRTKCDHCNTNRNRKKYIILTNGKEIKAVGSDCVKDFLPKVNIQDLIDHYKNCMAIEETQKNSEEWVKNADYYEVKSVVAMAAAWAGQYGWVSAAKAKETDATSSAQQLFGHINGWANKKENFVVSPAHYETAEAAIRWASAYQGPDNYLNNIKTICINQFAIAKEFGILASIAGAYSRALAETKPARPTGEFIGTPGRRETMTLTCESKQQLPDGQYGPKTIVRFRDEAGNLFVWFGSNVDWIEEGVPASYKFTLKKHQHYKEQAQNIIERVAPAAGHPKKEPKVTTITGGDDPL